MHPRSHPLSQATFLVGTPETVRAPRALSASSVYDSVFKGVDDGSITSYKLADLAVTRNKIAEGAVGRDQLAPGAVSALSLATGSVESGTLANGAVTTSHLQESSVTSRVLAESAVTRRAIARGAVGHEELGDGAVDGTNLADGSVTAAKLAAGAWLSNQAALGTVIWGEVHANGTAAVDGQYAVPNTAATTASRLRCHRRHHHFSTATFTLTTAATARRPPRRYAAAALPDKGAGAYELRFARPFTRPPVVHVSATSYAVCWAVPSAARDRWTAAVRPAHARRAHAGASSPRPPPHSTPDCILAETLPLPAPTSQVQCREPGLTEQPGLDGVMSVSFSNQKGTDMPSGFTFIAMETAPGTTS